ncbi:hypothetical protein MalM25_27750 [Planctomycetes bacterium MalM25]|nr:hypothetical protein MalM25_27750 [Planctomycetes bacterium MalM25]
MILNANFDDADPIDEIIFNLPAGQSTIELGFGELLISDSVTITGPGVTIDAQDGTDRVFGTGDGHRIFQIVGNSEVTLTGLTLTGGDVSPSEYFPTGGAILANDEFNNDHISLTLNGMVLEGNYAEQGGAIQMGVDMSEAVSSLQINGSTLTGNESEDLGGAVVVAASAATFFETIVSDNTVRFVSPTRGTSSPDLGSGGGVAVVSGLSTTTFISSVVTNNTSGHHGGGVYTQNSGPGKELVILDSSIYGNTAQFDGGGVYHCPKAGGDFMMANTTVSENATTAIDGRGGGVFLGAESRTDFTSIFNAFINNTTVARNTSKYGGGVYGYIGLGEFGNPASIDLTMHNSIVALNQDHSQQPNDLDAEFVVPTSGVQDAQLFETDSSHNLLGAVSSVLSAELLLAENNLKNQTQTELWLGALGYYGGFHPDFYTVPLRDGSNAIDAGDNSQANNPSDNNSALLYDQRGGDGLGGVADYPRRYDWTGGGTASDPTVDIGAFELQPAAPRVTNVKLLSLNGEAGEYDYDTEIDNGAPGVTGTQLIAALVAGADAIEVWFDEKVNLDANSLQINRISEFNSVGSEFDTSSVPTFSQQQEGSEWVGLWEFSDDFSMAQYLITLEDSITALDGAPLDGEWVNPASISTTNSAVSVFPSGDGVAGGDFAFAFTNLFSLGDNNIGDNELTALLGNWGSTGVTGGATDGDFDGNGSVGDGDLTLLLNNWGFDLTKLRIADENGDFVVDGSDNLTQLDADQNGTANEAVDAAILQLQQGLEFKYAF